MTLTPEQQAAADKAAADKAEADKVAAEAKAKADADAKAKEESRSPEEINAELDKTRKALKAANKEAAGRRKKLEAFEAAEDERKKAEMSEIDRLKLEGEELAAENTKLKFEGQQTAIATELGLPAEFADRIKKGTPEEMKADAEAMISAMPVKPEAHPKITNPGDSALDGETLEQKNLRLGI